jgi:hypothetical protein
MDVYYLKRATRRRRRKKKKKMGWLRCFYPMIGPAAAAAVVHKPSSP